MKNYFLIAVISVIFLLGININSYSQDKTKNVEKRELAKEAKNDVKQEMNTKAAKMKKKLDNNAKIEIAKPIKKL
jgi:hypothetical protein